jgi:hypothetical protein
VTPQLSFYKNFCVNIITPLWYFFLFKTLLKAFSLNKNELSLQKIIFNPTIFKKLTQLSALTVFIPTDFAITSND